MSSILDAVRYLGVDLLSGLLLSAQIFAAFEAGGARLLPVRQLRDRAMCRARIARIVADGPALRDEAYTAALLLDIGQLILACAVPASFRRVLDEARTGGVP